MFKSILNLWLIVFIIIINTALLAEDSCPRIRIALMLVDLNKEAYEQLIRQFPFQTKEFFMNEIKQKVLRKFQTLSDKDLQVDLLDNNPGYDYVLRYFVYLIACAEKKNKVSGERENFACYHFSGVLYRHDPCGLNSTSVLAFSKEELDLDLAVDGFVRGFQPLKSRLEIIEREHPVPPRGPRIEQGKAPSPVSALKEERIVHLETFLKNCRGEAVNFARKYAAIASRANGERGIFKPYDESASAKINNLWFIAPGQNGKIAFKYELKKGFEAGQEKLKIVACGIGGSVEKELIVEIQGLELKVIAEKKEINPGETVYLKLLLLRYDLSGKRDAVANQELKLKVSGLEDGKVYPDKNLVTDEKGEVKIRYTAGRTDRLVSFKTEFQPEGYNETLKAQESVQVKKEGALAIEIKMLIDCSQDQGRGYSTFKGDFEVSGVMKLSNTRKNSLQYTPENVGISGSYIGRNYLKNPPKDCPQSLVWETTFSGNRKLEKGEISLTYLSDEEAILKLFFPCSEINGKTRLLKEKCLWGDEKFVALAGINVVKIIKLLKGKSEIVGSVSSNDPNLGTFSAAPYLTLIFNYYDPGCLEKAMRIKNSKGSSGLEEMISGLNVLSGQLQTELQKTSSASIKGQVIVSWKLLRPE